MPARDGWDMTRFYFMHDLVCADIAKALKFYLMLLLAYIFSTSVLSAQEVNQDNIEPYILSSLVYDSNFFRLAGKQEAQKSLGDTTMDDFYTQIGAGVNMNTELSRQKLSLGAEVTRSNFSHFGFVDNTAGNGEIRWDWLVGKQWSGVVQYNYDRSLPSYADDQITLKDVLKDTVTKNGGLVSGRFQFTPEWAISANIKKIDKAHDADPVKLLDRNTTAFQLAMDYATSTDSGYSVYYRNSKVDFPDRPETSLLDNGYRDQWFGLTTQINSGGHSRAEAQLEYLRRNHVHLTDRDYSGLLWRLAYDWQITGKLAVEASLWRGIDQVEDVFANRVIEKALEFTPVWSVSEKIKISGDISSNHRNYINFTDTALAAARKDDLMTLGAQLEYTPVKLLRCIFRWERGDRNSNSDIYDFIYNSVSASIQLTF